MTLRSYAEGAIFGDDLGRGPIEVLGLHGWRRDRSDLVTALSGRPALLLDLPGFGSSPPPPEVWGAGDYAAAVAEVVDDLGAGRVVVVGHSFGGRVAVCLAAARPDLVRGLVICGAPLLRTSAPTKPALAYRVARRLHRWGLVSDRAMEARRRASGSADYRAATGVMRDVLVRSVNESYEAELRQIACPVAFLWGADDTEAPADVAARAAALVQQPVEVAVLAGVGHDVHLTRPDEVRRLVDAVVAASPGGA